MVIIHLSKVVVQVNIFLNYHCFFIDITRDLLKYINNKYVNLNRNMIIKNVPLLKILLKLFFCYLELNFNNILL